jgi:hypothetical protein
MKTKVIGTIAVVLVIGAVIFYNMMFFTVKSTQYAIKQAAFTGELTVYTSPGFYFLGGGDVFYYDRTMQLYFSEDA